MATSGPRLTSTRLHAEAGRQQMLILASSNAAMWGAGCGRTAMDPIAEHRGSGPRRQKLTGTRRAHGQIDGRLDTMTTNLRLSPGTNVCPECGVPYDQAGSDHQLEDRHE
jgi:hypothetical protein